MPYLGVAVLLPCVGSGLQTYHQPGDDRRRSHFLLALSQPLAHHIFRPIFFGDKANDPLGISIMLATTFVVATGMYLFVERRFIQPPEIPIGQHLENRGRFLVGHTGAGSDQPYHVFVQRLPLALAHAATRAWALARPSGLAGDLHDFQYYAGLSPITEKLGVRYEILGHPGCPMLYGVTLVGRGSLPGAAKLRAAALEPDQSAGHLRPAMGNLRRRHNPVRS
jgi:hypothetical protein